ncbi:MAG TPA: EFR1 family ferrodoxin, partial [bacterium]|nr:EFR1 family ferrodoxin [bacterium]
MKSVVYYFTGTGNSLVAARDIANALKAELFPIPVEVKKDKIQTDAQKIVIVFPVYAWGPPVIVREFVKKIEEVANKKILVLTT